MQRIHAHIDRNLASTDLSPTSIAAAHFISTRHLHGLFQEQGTSVSTWIRIRRLERCRRDLGTRCSPTAPSPPSPPAGASSTPRTSAATFKAAYEVSPSEFRAVPLTGILPGRARRLTIGARYVPRALSTVPHDRTMGEATRTAAGRREESPAIMNDTVTAAPVAAAADPSGEEWRTYDEFAAGIDTYRLPNASLEGDAICTAHGDDGPSLRPRLHRDRVTWSARRPLLTEDGATDPYDAVAVRDDVLFVNLPLESPRARPRSRSSSPRATHRAVVIALRTSPAEATEGNAAGDPAVRGRHDRRAAPPSGDAPRPSRDLIGTRNLYRYSPEHLYEHVYLSSQRYCWQCLEGVQRGHGDTDLSTVWKFDDGLYLFCFREFRIAVASVWLHDFGYQLRTTGIFLGLNGSGDGRALPSRRPHPPPRLVVYPDAQPI